MLEGYFMDAAAEH